MRSIAKRSRWQSKSRKRLERDILRECLQYLNVHPRVAFAFRANTGLVATPDGKRRFKAGFKGCSDIIGMLKEGRFLAIECKRPGEKATAYQSAFMLNVTRNGGLAFVAYSMADCKDMLG